VRSFSAVPSAGRQRHGDRPVAGVKVMPHSRQSDRSKTALSGPDGARSRPWHDPQPEDSPKSYRDGPIVRHYHRRVSLPASRGTCRYLEGWTHHE